MELIIYACTSWKWLENLRLGQAYVYYIMVKACGGSAYAAEQIKAIIRLGQNKEKVLQMLI